MIHQGFILFNNYGMSPSATRKKEQKVTEKGWKYVPQLFAKDDFIHYRTKQKVTSVIYICGCWDVKAFADVVQPFSNL